MKKRNAFLTLLIAMVISPIVVGVSSLKSKPAEVSAAVTETKRVWATPYNVLDFWYDAGAKTMLQTRAPNDTYIRYEMIEDVNNEMVTNGKTHKVYYYDVPTNVNGVQFYRGSGSNAWNYTGFRDYFEDNLYWIKNGDLGYNGHGFKTTSIVAAFAATIDTDVEACSASAVTTAVNTYNGLSTFEQNQFNALQVGEGFTGAQRLAYLRAFYNITTPLSVIETIKKDDNSLMATAIIGVIGLSTLAGYYFLQRKKPINV